MKLVGEILGIQVFVDDFMGRVWVNIAKRDKVIKMNPATIRRVIELLEKALENIGEKI